MHTNRFLESWLQRNSVIGHRARTRALVRVVDALLRGGKLALTHLGRHRDGTAFVKHHIKAVDRLLGHRHLHAERAGVYQVLARTLLRGLNRPVIIVDWTDCEFDRELLILKAALPIGGRAVSIYEEVHSLRRYNSPKTHRRFLRRLKTVLPDQCRPIIVTDAGFRGPWFREVESYGWNWAGRIRNRIKYFRSETGRWCYTHSLYRKATPRVRHLGKRCLSRRHRYGCRLYLVRACRRGPGRPRRRRSYATNDALYRRLHRAPWLLATSMTRRRDTGSIVKRIYSRRMQIEETFRDLKSHRWGFGLRYARTVNPMRLEVLLLIELLATVVLWLLGLAATARRWIRHFQANTERRRTVLSTVFLGREMLRSHRLKLDYRELSGALKRLENMVTAKAHLA